MKNTFKTVLIILFLTSFLTGCKEEDPVPVPTGDLIATDDSSTQNAVDATVTIEILKNDILSDENTATPEKVTVDLDPDVEGVQNNLIVEEEGEWSYNESSGKLTFSPVPGLYLNPTPIQYKLFEISTEKAVVATVEVTYNIAPFRTQKINHFVKDVMDDVYLWNKEIPNNIDLRTQFDSKEYFNDILYEEDNWSFITDDVEALLASFEGREKTFGYSLGFGVFRNSGTYYAVIEYVYPDTPADAAGLKRGDIIVRINGNSITASNYEDLFYSEQATLTMGIDDGTSITLGEDISLASEELSLDPVLINKIIEQDGHKIGYLFYAQYISEFNQSLDDALQYFADEQITDLVVDLRYNPGGGTDAAQHLCSSIAPLSTVNSNSTLVTFNWNDYYQNYWETMNVPSQLGISFLSNTPVKLGMDQVYILTGQGTASASELTITGLKPYMGVTTIGETTYGKYTASMTFTPDDVYSDAGYFADFENWGLQPIILKYANSRGETDFKNGFEPNIYVEDIVGLMAGIPLGDVQDPLLKTAIEQITGTEIVAQKSSLRKNSDYFIFDRGFSIYDANKRELLIDHIDKGQLFQQ